MTQTDDNTLSPERAVRLLRAKNAELEHAVHNNAVLNVKDLAADIALLYALVADHIERTGWAANAEVEEVVEDG